MDVRDSFSFPKSEKLTLQRHFDEVIKSGTRAFKHPVLALWVQTQMPDGPRVKVGISVPKKHFKKAHDRNLVKRWIREVYRTNSVELKKCAAVHNKTIALLFIVVSTDNISFELLQQKIPLLLREIAQQLADVK